MLRHYVTIAFRSLRRQWSYALITVGGLAVALAACIVIGLFVWHKASYDRFAPNADRVYRVVQEVQGDLLATTPPGLAQALQEASPDVEAATVVNPLADETLFERGEETFFVARAFRADDDFFEVFPYAFVQGNPQTALAQPGAVVLTASLAHRLFGDENPIGQVLRYEARADLAVTGVMEDPPTNAHFRPQALVSLSETQRATRYGSTVSWNWFDGVIYLALHPSSDPAALTHTFEALMKGAEIYATPTFSLEPLTSIHLHTKARDYLAPQSDARYLYLFGAIGLLVLVMACVNYVNLATARAATRAREVGVRKAVGAARAQVRGQFLGEALVVCGLALPVAVALAALTLPVVNSLAGLELEVGALFRPMALAALLALVAGVGVVSGAYPAFVLARFQPVRALRGNAAGGARSLLRTGLATFQFAAALVLLIATFVVQRQLQYVRDFNLGFDKEHVVTLDMPEPVRDAYRAFKQELLRSPAVVAVSSGPPMGKGWKTSVRPANPAEGRLVPLAEMAVDEDYVETMGLTLVAGRSFSSAHPSDSLSAAVVTRSAARYFGIEADPLGQEVNGRTVIGVVEDVYNLSLHEAAEPIVLLPRYGQNWTAIARLAPGATAEGLAALERAWQQFAPDRPFVFTFLDDDIQAQYQAEAKVARIFGLFSGLAILLACVGLLGLVAFSVQQRAKEIGIRKVLGATVPGLVALLTRDFVRLVGVALVVAAPLAYFLADKWLATFAYRVPWSAGVFALAALVTLALVLATTGFQVVRAATANPARTLRTE